MPGTTRKLQIQHVLLADQRLTATVNMLAMTLGRLSKLVQDDIEAIEASEMNALHRIVRPNLHFTITVEMDAP